MTTTVKFAKVDLQLIRKAKMAAAARGMTLKDFVVEAIENALPEDSDRQMAAWRPKAVRRNDG